MLIGVDFDNTIVCYDEIFRKVALERGLVPQTLPVSKNAVRDHLRRIGREDVWTEMQGHVYGPRMREAKPFDGAIRFFHRCGEQSIPVCIISHRTRYPYAGEKHDLHAAARDWLAAYGFHDPVRIGLPPERVYLEETKQAKIARIVSAGCTHFIDDLPEFLADPGFPEACRKILFDPNDQHAAAPVARQATRATSWDAICIY